jgi:hypothetical protein
MPEASIRAAAGGGERRFALSFSSEAPVIRWGVAEILDHSDGAADLGRLREIGVVLFNHGRDAVIGRIAKAWAGGGRCEAEIEFDGDELSERVRQKVAGGTLKGVSVGYMVHAWEEVKPGARSSCGRFAGPAAIARKWEPLEISIVSVPADGTVGVGRQESQGKIWVESGGSEMAESMLAGTGGAGGGAPEAAGGAQGAPERQNQAQAAPEAARAARAVEAQAAPEAARPTTGAPGGGAERQGQPEAARKGAEGGQAPAAGGEARDEVREAVEAERKRISAIRAACAQFGLPDADAERLVSRGVTLDEANAFILERVKAQMPGIGIRVERDEGDKIRDAAADSLLARGDVLQPGDGLAAGYESFMGCRLRDIAVECLEREGVHGARRMGGDEMLACLQRQFYSPTALFPAILSQTVGKAYEAGYRKAAATFGRWTTKGTLPDFKRSSAKYLTGSAGEFRLVPEGGELKHDTPPDFLGPQRQLQTWGRQFTLTREAFINDDIGYVTTLPARYAESAKRTINKQAYSVLAQNPIIYDGLPLFGAAHGNLAASGATFGTASLKAALEALQLQKDQQGEAIAIAPKFIIVPVGYSMAVHTTLHSLTIETGDNARAANPYLGSALEIVEDSALNALAGAGQPLPWFLAADPGTCRTVQIDYLNGRESPSMRKMETPGQLGFIWDCFLDWGLSVLDYRGLYRNPGVAAP